MPTIADAKQAFDRATGEGFYAHRSNLPRAACPYPYEESDPPGYILAVGWGIGWDAAESLLWANKLIIRMELSIERRGFAVCHECHRVYKATTKGNPVGHRCEP